MITEEFLYYIWQNRLITHHPLKLQSGEEIEILHPGYRNFESGPDFFNARIRIDGIVWAGNVEIHTRSSDWYKHQHEGDLNYDNIILHVVEIADAGIFRQDGTAMPTLVIQDRYPSSYRENYLDLIQGPACRRMLSGLPLFQRQQCLDRMLTEKLESRFEELNALYVQHEKKWPESFFQLLAKSFGFKVNAIPFELLAKTIPFSLFIRHRNNTEELEALLYGQSGLLPVASEEAYPERLKKHYRYLKHKYHLKGISPHLWKFGGLRPANFPTLRISQFAMLHTGEDFLLDKIISAIEIHEVARILDIMASDYWYQHYRFGLSSESYAKRLGKEAILTILINAIIPFLFFYGRKRHMPVLCDKALYWMEKCRPENNRIIREWQDFGWSAENAGQSQALLHLKKQYCDLKKCVNCGIGQYLLRQPCKIS